jgi:hypothetical protein
MSVGAKLISDYNVQVMSNPHIRVLVASVVQDPQNETLNVSASKASVGAAAGSFDDKGQARREIISWLNAVYFSNLESPLPVQWWWEMQTRIRKLLIVSMVLEGSNLRSFGCKPEKSDIPQSLIGIPLVLASKKAEFDSLKESFLADIDKYHKTEYIELYF